MKLSDALAKVTNSTTDKTAATVPSTAPAGSTSPSNDIGDRLKLALKEATEAEPQKTASAASSPTQDLLKMAADISSSEHESIVKEANLYGAAVADGFMARIAQYNQASAALTSGQPTKVASDDSFEKFAAENAELVKDAAQLGYDATKASLEKLSAAAYDAGWNNTVLQVHKTASDSFVAGYKFVVDMLEAAR